MATAVGAGPTDDKRDSASSLDEAAGPPDKLAAQIAHRIEAEVMRRGWPVGTSLGSELELREQFGVSRSVLREAVRLVEHHQVARMRRGPHGGLFVSAPDAGPATRAIVIYLEYVGTSVADLLHARLLLEPIAAGLAADRITEQGIATVRSVMRAELAHLEEPTVWSQHELHPVLGQLSGNAVLHLFIDVLTRLTSRYANTSRRLSKADVLDSKNTSHAEHDAIVEAVIAGDGARAQTLLTTHLQSVADWTEQHRVRRTSRISGRTIEPQPSEGSRAKLAEVVAARIHDGIQASGWQVGSVLGSEADLLSRYGISRAVLREAVRLLEYHAVARMRRGPGGGLVITVPEPQASVDTMALFLEFQGVTADDLRVVRNAIELGVVALVTALHAEGNSSVAERLTRAAQWPAAAASDGRRADVFHHELAELAGNPVLSLFLSIITELFRRHATGQDRPLPGDGAAEQVQHVHERILEAVLDGDAGLASHRMRRHLDALIPWWH
jgi:DNA-binding FadR family transcriptional regulator